MNMDLKKRELLIAALSISAILLAAIASTIFDVRLDLSSNKAYTLSKTARALRDELPEPVRITYYISKSLADRHPGPGAIEDMLREFEAVSKGKIRVRISDPSKDESEAKGFGLAAQQMQILERSEQRLALVYSGIVVEYLDRHQSIPAVISTETLEYSLIKAIRSAVSDSSPVAGLLVGDEDKSLANDYQSLASALAQSGYELREIRRGAAVDDDVDVLFVLGNADIDRYGSSFIDGFVMRGGRVFFAVKGVTISPEQGLAATAVPAGNLLSTLSSYGFDVARQLVLDRSNLTVPFETRGPTGGSTIRYVRYPHWVALDARFADKGNPITAKFAGLDLYWPSPMTVRPSPGATYVDLAKTTPEAWLQRNDFAASPEDSSRYELERDETKGQYLVAAAGSGSFRSAFASGDMPAKDGSPPVAPPTAAESPETRLVVVSSGDFLTDMMRMSESGFNASFALSAADWLCSSDDLIAIRSRAEVDSRLNRIQDADLKAFLIGLTYFVALGLVPGAVIAYGLARSAKRSRAEKESRAARGGEA